jgi:hypothetical protein
MREVGIGYSGHEKLRHRAALQGKPQLLASRYSMDLEKKKLEKDVEYTADGEVIALKSISAAVKKRIKHIGPNATKAALISVDKGDGRVLSTISFPYRHQGKSIPEVPCSTTNHLILKAWTGEDTYTTLSDRLSDVHNVIAVELGLPTFVGGDLAFLCINCGKQSSMTQACPWCDHSFDKSTSAEIDKIPFEPVVLPKKQKAVAQKLPIWPVEKENVSFMRYFIVSSDGQKSMIIFIDFKSQWIIQGNG